MISRLVIMNVLFYLAAFSTASFALPDADREECITRVLTYAPRTPVTMMGQTDESFLGNAGSYLNTFWNQRFAEGIQADDLGFTKSSFERFGLNDRILIRAPDYTPLSIQIYNGQRATPSVTLNDDPPMYLGLDHTIYLSHIWLENKLGGRIQNDSSWLYVMAHEAGHHIQEHCRILGLFEELGGASRRNLNMRLELQADCLAGFWIATQPGLFNVWEIQSLRTLTLELGSDIHGTGEQRWRWLQRGMKAQSVRDCNTFSVPWGAL